MSKLTKQAFTLIELLVVIAIIGILSGMIVVSMSGVTQKANLAKAQAFSNSLRNSLMADVVSEWKFEDGSGQTTTDSWGGLNNCTFGASTSTNTDDPTWTNSGCLYGNCLSFDGGDYLDCGAGSSLDITSALTVSAWVNPSSNIYGIVAKKQAGTSYSWRLYRYTDGRYFVSTGSSGADSASSAVHDDIGKWNFVTFVWNGSVNKIYFNGINETVNKVNYNVAPASFPSVPLTIGGNTVFFSGLIDEVRIHDIAAPISQIREEYYTGLNNLLINGNISKEEYLSRLNDYASDN